MNEVRPAELIDWLLEPEQPSVRYFVLTELLGRRADDPEVRSALTTLPRRGWGADLLRRQRPAGYWEPRVPTSFRGRFEFLYAPCFKASFWRMIVLADLGFTSRQPAVRRAVERLFEYKLRLGSMVNFFNDEVCAVGNLARMLTRFGYAEDYRTRKLFDRLIEDQRENDGWNCQPDRPGTLDGWEALGAFAALPPAKRSASMRRSIERGAEFYLERKLLREGRRYAPWFRLHYPNHYFYDVLVGLDLLTQLGYGADRRLGPALAILRDKRRADGRWEMDRVHPDVARGAFGVGSGVRPFALERPGRPSKWITLTALRVLHRVEAAG